MAMASTSSASSSRMVCPACASFSATTTFPKQSTRSETPRISRLGTMGVGFRLSGMCTTWRTSRPSSPRDPRMMWMTSLCPRVVMRPTLAPRFCTIAFVPTVVPWETSAVSASSAGTGCPHLRAAASSACMRPSAKSPGVEGALALTTRPPSSTITQSVNVPPMSRPHRYVDMGSATGTWPPAPSSSIQPPTRMGEARAVSRRLSAAKARRTCAHAVPPRACLPDTHPSVPAICRSGPTTRMATSWSATITTIGDRSSPPIGGTIRRAGPRSGSFRLWSTPSSGL